MPKLQTRDSQMPECQLKSGATNYIKKSLNANFYRGFDSKITIALVEDQVILNEGLRSLLKKVNNLNVINCNTSAIDNMLKQIKLVMPQIVIVSTKLKVPNPFHLCKTIRLQLPQTHVILFGDLYSDQTLSRALQLGVSAMLSPSESLEGIIHAIKLAVLGKRYFSKEIEQRVTAQYVISSDHKDSLTLKKDQISPREIEVLCCVAHGMQAKQIGKKLGITPKTVERHKSNLMTKLGLRSQVGLAMYAVKEGYIEA